jgi:hypothetical protein
LIEPYLRKFTGITTKNKTFNNLVLTTRTKDWKRRGEEGLIEITTNQSDPHASD